MQFKIRKADNQEMQEEKEEEKTKTIKIKLNLKKSPRIEVPIVVNARELEAKKPEERTTPVDKEETERILRELSMPDQG